VRELWAVVLAAALVAAVLLLQIRWSPRFAGMERDSGLFAYGGQQILHGALLYRDIFDTKPPAVFYLDALSFGLGGESVWPIWGLGIVWVTLVAVALFLVLRPITGNGAAFVATLLFTLVLLYADYYQGGNFTEVYALLPQVLTLGAAGWYFRSGRWLAITLVGFLTGLAILCKPTYVGLGAACMLVICGWELLDRRWRSALARLGLFAVGLLVPLGIVAAYWGARGELASLWDAVFVYDAAYVRGGLSLRSLYVTYRNLAEGAPMASLTVLCLGGMSLITYRLSPSLRRGEQRVVSQRGAAIDEDSSGSIPPRDLVLGVGLLAVPLEWALVALSGQNFGHYFMTPLPAMTVPVAYVLHRMWLDRPGPNPAGSWWLVSALLVTGLVASALVFGFVRDGPEPYQWVSFLRQPYGGDYQALPLVAYVRSHTEPSDTILVWGDAPSVYFQTGRHAPSRYLFATQLLLGTADARVRLKEFNTAVEEDAPALVMAEVDSTIGVPFIGSGKETVCATCPSEVELELERLNQYVLRHYRFEANVGTWTVYRRLGETGSP
jgi:hypothetical protein